MEVKKKLVMNFMPDLGRTVSISVDDPREDITEAEIKSCVVLVVSKNIFNHYDSSLVRAVEAKIVVTDTTEFNLVV